MIEKKLPQGANVMDSKQGAGFCGVSRNLRRLLRGSMLWHHVLQRGHTVCELLTIMGHGYAAGRSDGEAGPLNLGQLSHLFFEIWSSLVDSVVEIGQMMVDFGRTWSIPGHIWLNLVETGSMLVEAGVLCRFQASCSAERCSTLGNF